MKSNERKRQLEMIHCLKDDSIGDSNIKLSGTYYWVQMLLLYSITMSSKPLPEQIICD